jgi:hypothetical protein
VSIDLESRLNLEADREAVAALLAEHGGRLHQDPEDGACYWLELHPVSDPPEAFYVRVLWTRYPDDPPSVKFATAVGGSVDVTRAWPQIPGYRPGSFDICMPFTAEGFNVHPEWRETSEAWRTSGSPFLWVAQTLQRDLNQRYGGRHP